MSKKIWRETSITEDEAKALVKALGKSEVYDLYLDGLTSISEKAAKALANYNGADLSLKGLTSITEDEAKALGKSEVHNLYRMALT
jgi:hypothetical protein